ncbi:MAG: hypothetical protein J0L92_18600 [Deltaproteobacteria bacterium]|nr:hypothetical protein [Deltaproteobacteria bacterium]
MPIRNALEAAVLICPVLLFVLALGGWIAWRMMQTRRYRDAITEWSSRRGVSLLTPHPGVSFQAQLDGANVRLGHRNRRLRTNGRRREHWTFQLVADVPAPMGDLVVRPHQGALSDLFDSLTQGLRDVQVGDEAFDRTFIVSTAHDDAARAFFTPPRRAAFLEALSSARAIGLEGLSVETGTVQLHGRGFVPVEKLDAAIAILAKLALACAGR